MMVKARMTFWHGSGRLELGAVGSALGVRQAKATVMAQRPLRGEREAHYVVLDDL